MLAGAGVGAGRLRGCGAPHPVRRTVGSAAGSPAKLRRPPRVSKERRPRERQGGAFVQGCCNEGASQGEASREKLTKAGAAKPDDDLFNHARPEARAPGDPADDERQYGEGDRRHPVPIFAVERDGRERSQHDGAAERGAP